MNCTGLARCENTGSVSTLSPPACTSMLAWPTQVMAGGGDAVPGAANAGA
jgi:hypothetical protein